MNEEIQKLLAQRAGLLAEAEALLNQSDVAGFEAKEKEILDLDASIEKMKLSLVNARALQDNTVAIDFTKNGVNPGAITSIGQFGLGVPDTIAYENVFGKYLMGNKLSADEKQVFENTNKSFQNVLQTMGNNAVVIPETVARGIWKEAEGLYPILSDVGLTYVPGTLTLYKENESGTDAEWYDEETEVTDSTVAIGELNLNGCELAKSIPVSWKLRRMAVEDFIDYVKMKLAEKLGAALAKAIVNGKGKVLDNNQGKPEPRGILTALAAEANTPQIRTYSESIGLAYTDLTATMAAIKSVYKKGAKFYADGSTIWNKLANILDENGKPIFITDVTSGGIGHIFGLTVEEDDSVPSGAVLVGNVSKGYAGNVNQDMAIYTEDHVKARKTDYMGYAIVDGDVITTKAFAYLTATA